MPLSETSALLGVLERIRYCGRFQNVLF